MTSFNISCTGTAIVSLLIGLFVFIKNWQGSINRKWALFCLSVAIWSYGLGMMTSATDIESAEFWIRIHYLGAIMIGPLFMDFVLRLLNQSRRTALIVSYFSAGLLEVMNLSHLLAYPAPLPPFNYYTKPEKPYFLFVAFFATVVTYSLKLLFEAYKSATGQTRNQLKLLFIGLAVGFCGGSTAFFPVFNLPLFPYGIYFVAVYTIIVTYTIIQYRFFDIQTVLHKTLTWLTISSIVLVPLIGGLYFTKNFFVSLSPIRFATYISAVVALLIPYTKFIQPHIDHLFQRRRYDMQKILQGMVKELVALKSVAGLIGKIAGTIEEALYVSRVTLILWSDKEQRFNVVKGEAPSEEAPITGDYLFLTWMREKDRVIEWEELSYNPEYEFIRPLAHAYFKKFNAKVALPLIHDGKLIGLVNLGEKENLKPFSSMDLDFLSNLRAEASIALSNSLLYDDVAKMSEELRRWASELERKVEDRTSELAESKRQLEESYQKLQELDQLKSKFFANISHELRTPITLILAPTEMMLNRDLGELNPDQEKYLSIMQTNSLRLLKLINNLLDLAKVDAGKMELYYNRADFSKFVSGVVASVSPMAEKKSLALRFESDPSIPEIFFDADKIEKVLLNLIFNALKFTEKGEIKVACIREDNQVAVRITDTGIGIPKGHMSKLFSRFSQADSSASRKFEGTGIGLALAKELVELHQGKIWAESEEGRGSTFHFVLPIYVRLEEVPGALDRRSEALPVSEKRREEDWTRSLQTKADYATDELVRETASLPEESPHSGVEYRILLVDDNPDMLSYIASQLKADYRLLFSKDGKEGVERAKLELPDLIISDVMMPYKDGYQLCHEIKEEPRTCHIPIILLTAKTDLSTKIEGLEHGADDYLTKPFNAQELRARVRSLINLRKLEREIQQRSNQLEETLNTLKETQGQLVQSEKMAALGLLIAGVAHEINNPVSFAKGSLAIVRRVLDEMKNAERLSPAELAELSEDLETSIQVIKNGLDRTENIIRNLKSFVRKDEEILKAYHLEEGIESTLQLFRHETTHRITLLPDYGRTPSIEAIPGQINQAIMNILQNAVQSISDRGEIVIKTEQIGNQVRISIRDTGCGIPEKDLPRIFDPFFTTKEVGKGTGLGMTITYKIIENHHGRIEVTSTVGRGTEVVLHLPISQPGGSSLIGRGLYAGSTPI
ncbi:MAG: response regulator [Nitrospirae bacterium]|nr:response regulator [Candidatus Manganitrophaceae bacterium]